MTEILKPTSDDREYRLITLSNGLVAVLVRDTETNYGAASITVDAGQFDDPPEVQGLAHFLEHMLFLGTEKYPEESGFDEFCSSAAGYTNAYTGMNTTTYHWLLTSEHLREGLSRFASFFICPLLSPSATEREVQAVDSEHCKNKQEDANRFLQLERSTSRAGHPFNLFGTGCYHTLHDLPLQQGTNIHEHLVSFYKRFYSARKMRLCVLGPESLETLEGWVRESFSDLPDFEVERIPPIPAQREEIFGGEWFGTYKIIPVKSKRSLTLLFPLPPTYPSFRSKPHRFFSFCLGHEGKGSILMLLKELGLGYELMAGATTILREFSVFVVDVGLTPLGLQRYEEVVAIIFAYINLLRAAPDSEVERVYNEVKTMADLNFHYKKKEREDDYTDEISNNLFKFPPECALAGPHIFLDDFSRGPIDALARDFTVSNLRLHVIAPEGELKDLPPATTEFKEEQWYGTRYAHTPFPAPLATSWDSSSPATFPSLALPLPNAFLASDLSLHALSSPLPPVPSLIKSEDALSFYLLHDLSFRLPLAASLIGLSTPLATESAKSAALTRMILEVLEEVANELTYDASEAGLEFKVTNTSNTSSVIGLRLESRGFSQTLPALIQRVLRQLVHLPVKDDVFALIQRKTVDDYRNRVFQQPYMHAVNAANAATQHPFFSDAERLVEVEAMTAEDLRAFVPRFFSSVLVEGLVLGNMTKEEAQAFVEETFSFTDMWKKPSGPPPAFGVTRFAPDKVYRQVIPVPNDKDENSAALFALQVGPRSIREDCLVEIFVQLLSHSLYSTLRTVEQLGYIVAVVMARKEHVQALHIFVQSSRSPQYLEERIENALVLFRKELEEMGEEGLKLHCESLAQKKLSPHRTVKEKADTLFQEIANRTFVWDRLEQEAAALRALGAADILGFFDSVLAKGGARRGKLVSMLVGRDAREAGAQTVPPDSASKIFISPADVPPSGDWLGQAEVMELAEFKRTTAKF